MPSLLRRERGRQVELGRRAGPFLPVGDGIGSSQKGDLRARSALRGFAFPSKVVDRRTFLLRLESTRDDGIKALRAILKSLLPERRGKGRSRWRGAPTPKQIKWLTDIYERLWGRPD
jgi:hypothetical protein